MSDMNKKYLLYDSIGIHCKKEEKVSWAVGIQDGDSMTRWEQGRAVRGLVTFYLFLAALCLHCFAQAL